jgi:2-oxoglutarate dehydrogenase E1 component
VRGHLEADLDPLRLEQRRAHNELDYHTWGFTEADLDREIFINTLGRERASLRDIIAILRETYCGRIGIEYMHIQVLAERQWIQQKFEHLHDRPQLTNAAKREVLRVLTAAETFERFLDRRYTGTKRFGIEGAESLMPALEAILRCGAELGIREFVIGMPHRGRLNVLANFMGAVRRDLPNSGQRRQPRARQGWATSNTIWHLGRPRDRGRTVHLSLAAQPVAFEAVDPVVLGGARQASARRRRNQVVGILMHGDAAFAGQGLSRSRWSWPICAASAPAARSTSSSTTDRVYDEPVLRAPSPCRMSLRGFRRRSFVNGDDPEAVSRGARPSIPPALQEGRRIDLFGYRRHGHNNRTRRHSRSR